jgi:hypothetical protein
VLDHLHDLVVGFLLPAYDAAVELGAETALAQVRRTLEKGLGEVVDLLRRLAPQLDEAQLAALGAGLQRNVLSLLLDRATPPEHFRRDLDALIRGYTVPHAATASG